jgi:hypothetical protein
MKRMLRLEFRGWLKCGCVWTKLYRIVPESVIKAIPNMTVQAVDLDQCRNSTVIELGCCREQAIDEPDDESYYRNDQKLRDRFDARP